jgi:3-oxoacyl-[acyl-carrier protein] reductase
VDSSYALPGLAGAGVAVTGGASGIGRATALLAARSGASVVAGDINAELLAELEALAKDEGLPIRTVRLDVADPGSVAEFVATGDADGNLRGVVNAAAVAVERSAVDVSYDFWLNVVAVNLTGAFLVCQGAARIMIERGTGGSIVNVASAAALNGSAGLAPYSATKGGLVSLSKALAREWGPHKVRVNCVSPGAVDTPLYHAQPTKRDVIAALPLGRIGTPQDLALSIGFLLTDLSSWTTGQNLNVNGGSLMY